MRTWYRNLDYVALFLWMALVAVGLTAIYSTTHGPASEFLLESVQKNFERQMVWAGISLFGIVVALLLPVPFYQKAAYPVYALTILLLVAALVAGRDRFLGR